MIEPVAASCLAAVLLLLAAVYAWKQIRVLRTTTPQYEMLPDERQFLRRMAWRRLINSGLMVLLAGLIGAAYPSGLQQRADALGDRRQQERRAEGHAAPLTPQEKQFSRLFGGYWIATLLLLGVIVAVAGLDLFATRRYGLWKLRQIQNDRRAMIQRNLDRHRRERDGLSE